MTAMDEINAFHESGHALLSILVGARVKHVTLEPDWDDGPERFAEIQVEWPLDQFSTKQLQQNMVMVALAGPVAEMLHTGDPFHPGHVREWAADWNAAWQAASSLFPNERQRMVFLERSTQEIYRLFSEDHHWAALGAIVDNLLAHETLEGDDVEEIVRTWL